MTAEEFFTNLPSKANPEALAGMNTVFHFNLDDGAIQKTISVTDGIMDIQYGLIGK